MTRRIHALAEAIARTAGKPRRSCCTGPARPHPVHKTGSNRSVMVRSNWVVVDQQPAAGEVVGARSAVVLSYDRPPDSVGGIPAGALADVPTLISLPLNMAEDRLREAGFRIDQFDIAPNLVADRAGQPQRGVFDSSNWVVVAQCGVGEQAETGSTIIVGVVQLAERSTVQSQAMADNQFVSFLDC